jgi:iron complex transport system permease protein
MQATEIAVADIEELTPSRGVDWRFVVCLCAFFAALILDLLIGSVTIPLRQAISALTGAVGGNTEWGRIIHDLRLPRALTAMLAGAALGIGGLQMQTVFRNPLASPWTMGLTAGSQLGVAIVVALVGTAGISSFGHADLLGNVALTAAAAAGSALVLTAILSISRRAGALTLLIIGLMLNYLARALVGVALHFADESQTRIYENWNDGTFGATTWAQMPILAMLVLAGVIFAHTLVKPLNALLLGEKYAHSLGVNAGRARKSSLICAAVLEGVVTAYCGPVVFLGVAVPHLCRGLLNTADHRQLMPATALLGSTLAMTSDLITHLPWQRHYLHLNAVNSLIGAPVVIWIVLRRSQARSMEP